VTTTGAADSRQRLFCIPPKVKNLNNSKRGLRNDETYFQISPTDYDCYATTTAGIYG